METDSGGTTHLFRAEDVQADLIAFKKELRDIGLGNESDRLSAGIALSAELRTALANGGGEDFLRAHEGLQLAHILSELQDFRQIYLGFKGRLTTISNKLRVSLSGALNVRDETPKSTHARNIAFELSLASALKLRGIEVTVLDKETDGDSDVVSHWNGNCVRFACKRAFSEFNIAKAIKKAKHQLRKCVNSDRKEHGIIAICLSRPLYDSYKGTVPLLVAPPENALANWIDTIAIGARKEYFKIDDRFMMSVFFRVAGPIRLEHPDGRRRLTHAEFWSSHGGWPKQDFTALQHSLMMSINTLLRQAPA